MKTLKKTFIDAIREPLLYDYCPNESLHDLVLIGYKTKQLTLYCKNCKLYLEIDLEKLEQNIKKQNYQ